MFNCRISDNSLYFYFFFFTSVHLWLLAVQTNIENSSVLNFEAGGIPPIWYLLYIIIYILHRCRTIQTIIKNSSVFAMVALCIFTYICVCNRNINIFTQFTYIFLHLSHFSINMFATTTITTVIKMQCKHWTSATCHAIEH